MIEYIKDLWYKNGYMYLLILAGIIILVLALFRIGKRGTYNSKLPPIKDIIRESLRNHIPNEVTRNINMGYNNSMNSQYDSRTQFDQYDSHSMSAPYDSRTQFASYDPYRDNTAKNAGESKPERRCREILQSLFGKPFNKYRPDVLRNPVTKDYNLEIDCYNPEMRLGLEYNGKQHYVYNPFFHKTRDAFENQKYRDEIKRRLCKEMGITLIEVPYTVKYKDLEKYIIKKLRSI